MHIAIHIEATELPRLHLALTHPFQPHMLVFCGTVFDGAGNEIDRLFTLVKPVAPTLVSVNSTADRRALLERADVEGRHPISVLQWFDAYARNAKHLVSEDVTFDISVMLIVRARLTRREGQLNSTLLHAAASRSWRPKPKDQSQNDVR